MPRPPFLRSLPAGTLTAVLIAALVTGLVVAQELTIPTYLPAVYLQPTLTPTFTSTPTVTPTATRTQAVGAVDRVQGTLVLCNPGKTTYAVGENVCVVETLFNPGDNGVVSFGLAGVAVNRLPIGSGDRFQTSWGEGHEFWDLCSGCTGPMDGSSGPWMDNIRGLDNNEGFESPGSYQLTFAVCYANYSACPSAPANQWRTYTSIVITVQ